MFVRDDGGRYEIIAVGFEPSSFCGKVVEIGMVMVVMMVVGMGAEGVRSEMDSRVGLSGGGHEVVIFLGLEY